MDKLKNLLFEIGTEELPSSSIVEGISGLKSLMEENLKDNRISYGDVKTFATPRRIVAFVSGIEEKQRATEKIITGPPRKIAFDSNGKPTDAAIGFARSLNIDVSKLQEIDNGRGIYMGLKILEKSKSTEVILPDLLRNVTLSLAFSKQMTWGDYSIKFARPIRWLVALYGDKIVKFGIESISSKATTFGHRATGNKPVKIPRIKDISDYFRFLENEGNVILDPLRRKEMILDKIKEIECQNWKGRLKVIIDEDLLAEVVNLVEIPNVLIGSLPEEYLYMPREILVKAIQHHQRYFAVLDSSGNVASKFLVIQNGVEDKNGEVAGGNERVLKARLSDARFFYEEDKKHDFDFWYKKLEGVIFYSGLGSLSDKARRLRKNCIEIASLLDRKGMKEMSSYVDELSRASAICKCDLVTNLVVEFPELQGLVGREYAREKGEKDEVASAIFEHYLPRFSGDLLPETTTGSVLSIADKIDTIAGMFLTENIPTGSQDPFALRRKASGIILTALKKGYDIDIYNISEFGLKHYLEKFNFENIDTGKLTRSITDFILARYRFRLEKAAKRVDIFNSIVSAGCYSVIELEMRYRSLEEYASKKDMVKNIAEPFIRCKNIIKGREFSKIKSEFLVEDSEKKLYTVLDKKEKSIQKLLTSRNYGPVLVELEDFASHVNCFFDDVLVMDEDEKLRINRLNIVKGCADLYLLFADFSKIG